MTHLKTVLATCAMTLHLAVPVLLASQAAAPAPPATLSGPWTMKISMPQEETEASLALTQQGSTIEGTLSNEHLGTMSLKGTNDHGALAFVVDGEAMGQVVHLEYTGKVRPDGTIAGDMTSPFGNATWSAARIKK